MSSIDEIRSKFVVDKISEKNEREENKNITNIEISKLVAFRKG
ncbi:unknown [Clostridium sp. CAG:793]|nr:unknown [Clostridium sp. CAG:793]